MAFTNKKEIQEPFYKMFHKALPSEGGTDSPLLSQCGSEDEDRPSPCPSSNTPSGSDSHLSRDSLSGSGDGFLPPTHSACVALLDYPGSGIAMQREMAKLRLSLDEATRLLADKDEALEAMKAELATFKSLYKEAIMLIPPSQAHEGLMGPSGSAAVPLHQATSAVCISRGQQPGCGRQQTSSAGAGVGGARERGTWAYGWREQTSRMKQVAKPGTEGESGMDVVLGSWDVCNVW